MKSINPVLLFAFALSLAACGGKNLSVDLAPGGDANDLEFVFPPGRAVEHQLPFRISGGIPPYDARVDACPPWVTLFPDQGVLAGARPAGDHDDYLCTYVVTDSGTPRRSASYGLRLTVPASLRHPLVLPGVDDQTFIIGTYRSVLLPQASGGVQPYAYELTCPGGLPAGLHFSERTRVLSGTPTAAYRGSCSYSVTDSNDPMGVESRSVDLHVRGAGLDPLRLRPPVDQSFTVGDSVNVRLLEASGGIPPYTYVLDCPGGTLPEGLSFSSQTGVLSGRPRNPWYGACDYSVSDSSVPAQGTLPESLVLSVTGTSASVLRIDAAGYPDAVELPVEQITRRALPPVSGGTPPYELSLVDCPDWVQRSGGDVLAYPPRSDPGVPARCTFSVRDSAMPAPATDSHVFFVRAVHPDPGSFYFETRHVVERNFPVGQSVTPVALPRALNGRSARAGGEVELTYNLTPALPEGLCLHAERGAVSRNAACPGDSPDSRYTYSDTYSPETDDHPKHLWIIGTPRFSSALRRYCWSVRDTAGTRPPAERCFYLATVSYDVPRFTNLPDERAVIIRSIVLRHTNPCTGCPVEGSPTPSSLDSYDIPLPLAVLPHDWEATTYGHYHLEPRFAGDSPFEFVDPSNADTTPRIRWTVPRPLEEHPLTAYTYGISRTDDAAAPEAAICLDLRFAPRPERYIVHKPAVAGNPEEGYWIVEWGPTWRFRDEAIRRSTGEFLCFPRPLGDDSPSLNQSPGTTSAAQSNPVHQALGPVHARRAAGVAHAAIRDRVAAGRREGAALRLNPSADFASLSGLSEGFDYSGSSESVNMGAELGAGSLQAGLVASFTRTDLRYHAGTGLSGQGYHAGEHDTEIVSVHPFAAWHAPAGGYLWASLGAGSGSLRHRDDLGFPSWSRSDVQLRTYAAGASIPLAEVMHGELQALADIESFALEIEGGDRISTELPTLRGRDYRAGLAWSASVFGRPEASLAYKRLSGDGPEGAQVEARGSASFAGILDPRLTLTGRAEASFGLGDYEQDSWSLGGGVEFTADRLGRGVTLDLDTRMASLDDGGSAGVGLQAEVGYGLWGGPFLGELRPYAGLAFSPGGVSYRRSAGLHLRDTNASQVSVEVYDQSRVRASGLALRLTTAF